MGAILLGLVPAIGWGFQGIVMQKIGGNTANKQMGMVLSALVLGIIVLAVHPISWTPTLIAAAALNGIPWSVGQILQIKAFDYLGVSRTMPVSTGLTLLGTTLLGAFVFHEWTQTWQFVAGFVALALIIVGVACTAYQENKDDGSIDLKRGIVALVISSIAYLFYSAAGTVFAVDGLDLIFPQAIAMVCSTVVIACFLCSKTAPEGIGDREQGVFGKKSFQNMIAGVLFAAANFAVILSTQLNGLAVGWTLGQMNVIVSTLGGLFILHEKKTKKELTFVVAGMVLVALGGILIGITKQ